jgi:hypothetical protein
LVLSASTTTKPRALWASSPLAAKAGPGAQTETGLGNKSAVAFEKHRIRLRMAAAVGAHHAIMA